MPLMLIADGPQPNERSTDELAAKISIDCCPDARVALVKASDSEPFERDNGRWAILSQQAERRNRETGPPIYVRRLRFGGHKSPFRPCASHSEASEKLASAIILAVIRALE